MNRILIILMLGVLALPCAAQQDVTDAPAPPRADIEALYQESSLRGFTVRVRREFSEAEPELLARVLLQLESDLDEIENIVPPPALEAIRRHTGIWIELRGAVNPGMSGRGMCCHWSAEWLESNGLPGEKAGGIEIVNPSDFLDWRRSQPYMTLHELAHAYHRMIGDRLPEIVEPFEAAMEAGLYESVGRNSVASGDTVRAYAATNHHEYFAEVSEAYLALNDFEPYSRKQLAAHDPAGFEMARTLWNLTADEIQTRIRAEGTVEP